MTRPGPTTRVQSRRKAEKLTQLMRFTGKSNPVLLSVVERAGKGGR